MLEINANSFIRLSDAIVIQALSDLDQFYAFNVETGDHFRLNGTAYWLLKNISSDTTFSTLLKAFCSEYSIDEKTARQDISDILRFFLNNNLITLQED